MKPAASLASRYLQRERVLKQEAAGTIVLLDMDTAKYFTLNDVGGRVWDLCDGSRTLGEIVVLISQEFDAPTETVEADLLELLAELANENLVGKNT